MYVYKDEELKLSNVEDIIDIECEDVLLEEFSEIKKLGEAMINYCIENSGLGLAAPQVGILKNMFVWRNAENSYQIILNPKTFPGKKKTNVVESCLSYPDENYFLVRSKEVRVKFFYVEGDEMKSHSKNLHGERSFIFQHEFDHLSGKTIATIGTNFAKIK